MNLAMIAAALGIAPLFSQPVEGLAWGVLLAGVLQLAVQLPALKRTGFVAAATPVQRAMPACARSSS